MDLITGERPDTIYFEKIPVKWFNVSFLSNYLI